MRVAGGIHRGMALAAPKSRNIRPTSERIRQALFNILEHGVEGFSLEGARVCDLFAGTGALGIEALSRGAKFCLFIDDLAEARALIRRNVDALGATGNSKIWRRDATSLGKAVPMPPFDLLFADPPYGKGFGEKALSIAVSGGWLTKNAICVMEEDAKSEIGETEGLEQFDKRVYGDTQVVFFRRV